MTPQELLEKPYSRIVIPSDGGFHAEIMEFPGCFAQGDSPEAAYRNLESSAVAWIESCIELDQTIPEPFSNLGFGGKIALRLPKSLHREASRMAAQDGVSLNQFLVSAIAYRVGAEDCYRVMAERLLGHSMQEKPKVGKRPRTPEKVRGQNAARKRDRSLDVASM